MKNEDNPLLAIAMAALDIPELARGIVGEVQIEQPGMGAEGAIEAINRIHEAQVLLKQEGWVRRKPHERNAPYTHNIEVAVYRKKFEDAQYTNWIVVTIATRFGVSSTWTGIGPKRFGPWD